MLFLIFAVVTIIAVFPWFAVGIALLGVVFTVIYVYFRSAIRELKRMDNLTRLGI